ncbi:UDP-N-acteylglucosamine pyrophosphorylase 1 [Plasmodium gonderi]|uniref:UDP-N-acetylglucosamine diphosphorylase n=1 Tax=Plasmodium gonderi TaxID=77519 RepID=A0A1Y1JI04_PLAGO|nr:UDP-N-acteylglucosamine pyrophosphorylase 1 [Plasmodium gonderi]GAW82139.1 UDP-N-acteylglucosamine pyrophosphorylase 1 [Plasmodium gonderi]
MDGILNLLTEQNQLLLHEYLKQRNQESFTNLNINHLEFFLNKLSEIKNTLNEREKDEYVVEAPPTVDINSIHECNVKPPNGAIFIENYKKKNLMNELKHIGLEIVKRSEVAVLFLAGGLGSRLGIDKPKGLLEITPIHNKTFFQFYFEQIKFLEEFSMTIDTARSNANIRNKFNCYYPEVGITSCNSNYSNDDLPNVFRSCDNVNRKGNMAYASSSNPNLLHASTPITEVKETTIYIYIMTSSYTHEKTVNFLEENKFFGLKKENIIFFKQCDNYSTDFNFNILLSNQNTLLTFPGGNGALFSALDRNEIIDDMIQKNIKYVQIVSVDNVLNKISDPVLIGFCSFFQCDIANKAVKMEEVGSVGIFCLKGNEKKLTHDEHNNFSVCEYTELNKYILKNPEVFKYGNICHHVFSLNFLHHIVKNKLYNNMKLHKISRKKEYYDFSVYPNEKSSMSSSTVYCYEYFIFDIFKYAKNILSFEVSRDEEFYPIKNNNNGNTILNAHTKLSMLHKSWLENMKFNIIPNPMEHLNMCEISPLVSYDGAFFFHLPKRKDVHLPFSLDLGSSP